MEKIKFEHEFRKLLDGNGQLITHATLLEVVPVRLETLSEDFIEYNTEGKYALPRTGQYLLLIFQKQASYMFAATNVFTTLQKDKQANRERYMGMKGRTFEVVEVVTEAKANCGATIVLVAAGQDNFRILQNSELGFPLVEVTG